MVTSRLDCPLCRGIAADPELQRVQMWENTYWRLTTSLAAEVLGFSYLEPKRHIPSIAELDGEEAHTLGEVLAQVARVLRDETGAELVYIYVFGDSVPHLHFHLAPHRTGDALNDQMIRSEIIVEKLASGAERLISKDFPPLPEATQWSVIQRIQRRLESFKSP